MTSPKSLRLPLDRAQLSTLCAGDACLLSGPLFTLRDAGHLRLLDELASSDALPYDLEGQTLFYAGPTPAAAARPFGAIGPTTASRMDFATPALHAAGIVATIGKGQRGSAVIEACKSCGCVYFVAVGGAAAFLAKCIESSQTLAYDELGTEALRRIEVIDFPVFVGVDTRGNDLYSL
ncbi:MAG: FumA C-terminus/TtdB family hydratase beta subunit [Raoultibacter sp.]